MKRLLTTSIIAFSIFHAYADGTDGGITKDMLTEISRHYKDNAADKAIRNAMDAASINVLAANAGNKAMIDTHFSDKVKTQGITNQKKSGRCWLFTGLNVLRAQVIEKHGLGEFQFSQNYCFFYDQLEKANLFLQAVIDTRKLPFDDRKVDFLFSYPLGDGGTFAGVADLVEKYGLVPSTVMPESYCADNTAEMRTRLRSLLRQYGMELRAAKSDGKDGRLESRKIEMLGEVYRILALCLGVPPTEFEWACHNKKGELVSCKKYTPLEFYKEYVADDLNGNYVMFMNDPTREYGKVYEIEYDRHLYDGHNWKWVNLPIEKIKEMAIASIKGGKAMYFSCDVGKFINRQKGVLDLKNYDYESLLGVKFTMNKKERILTHDSGSSHAMTLMAVDIKDGKSVKWMVENSWGASSGYKGHLIMTDEWFDEYMFRLVVEKQFVPSDVMEIAGQKAIKLPVWDPMFLSEE